MIIISRHHIRAAFRQMRINRKLTQAQLAERLHVTRKAINYRESGRFHMDLDVVIDTAAEFGYSVALVKRDRPSARPTGTGWPA